jgi:hypothetical protein
LRDQLAVLVALGDRLGQLRQRVVVGITSCATVIDSISTPTSLQRGATFFICWCRAVLVAYQVMPELYVMPCDEGVRRTRSSRSSPCP